MIKETLAFEVDGQLFATREEAQSHEASVVWPKTITMYLHSDTEVNWGKAEELGLSGEAITEHFKHTLSEVKFELEVFEDGSSNILTVDGQKLEAAE